MKRGPRRFNALSGQNTASIPNRLVAFHQGRRAGETIAAARRNYVRYLARAREASLRGDRVEMENSYQHAEHYFRVMNAGSARDD
jgi:hypothetical protein